jgi:Zn-dependent protease with chaperone function
MVKNIFWVTLLFLGLTLHTIGGQMSEVDQALVALGTGSAQEMKGRLFTDRITIISPEDCARALASLPEAIRNHKISTGRLLRRVEKIFADVLELHGRADRDRMELYLFRDDVPTGAVWRGCVLLLSEGLAEPLTDGELTGVIAHELGHAYFEDEMAAAQRAGDALRMRVIELKCDAISILSLRLSGYDPSFYVRGLGRIQTILKKQGRSSSIFQSHPDLVTRAQFSRRFIKSLA